MEAEIDQRLHATVEGYVQGVGFRYFVAEQAQELDLTGWVRNLYNGQVEVTAEGARSRLETLLSRLRTGPRSGFVTDVKYEWSEAKGEFSRFVILSTA